ncbi:hypothetical protein BKA70DRAFT_1289246 [Coprinopsis sp. MPI-PUGE-AT-0042]|nr:hypothetical protein BKA70DRAFT_1289246 [Coprinopsis sp. MPI-PUGE-AT-0042]
MSLFRPDLWFPESVDYSVQLLTRSVWLADYFAANIIMAVFVTAQVIACWYIVTNYMKSRRRKHQEKLRGGKSEMPVSMAWCCTSVALAVLYAAAAVTYWTGFGQRYHALTKIGGYFETEGQTMQWFRDHPDHEGVKMICTPGIDQPRLCHRFKYTKNVLAYKVVELSFASLVETIILLADGGAGKFFVIFSLEKWVNYATVVLGIFALTGPVMGIVVLAKVGELGSKSDPWLGASWPLGPFRFLMWNSPLIAISLAVCVNLIVTAAIVIHITLSKRSIRRLVGKLPSDSDYTSVVATLVESALPAALFGVFAVLFPVAGHVGDLDGNGSLDMISFSFKILWVAFTALAPQLIIIRVIAGQCWTHETARGGLTSSGLPIAFGSFSMTRNSRSSKTNTNRHSGVDPERPTSAFLSLRSLTSDRGRPRSQ